MEPSSVDPKTEEVISLWESAAAHSEAGRFHEAVVGYERARQLLEESRIVGESEGSSDRVACVLKALLERVHAELADHLTLLEGNHYLALGLKRGAEPKTIKKVWRAFALLYHPDKNRKIADTSALFRAGQTAHDTLSNPDLAASYMPRVRPEEWLARRAAETNRLARLEQRRRQKVSAESSREDRSTNPAPKTSGTQYDASSQPKSAARASSFDAKPSATQSSRSCDGQSERRWLRPDELQALRVGELVAQLASVGLASAVKPGMERTELERVYLAAAAARAAGIASANSRSRDGSAASSEEKKQPAAAARPTSDHRFGAEQHASNSKATTKKTDYSRKNGAAGVVPEPPAPRPEGGVKVTKDDLRRHEERMFGRHRNTATTTTGKPTPASAADANATAAGFKHTTRSAEHNVNVTDSKAVPPPSSSPLRGKEKQEDKGWYNSDISSSESRFASNSGDVAAAYSAAYAASSGWQRRDCEHPLRSEEAKGASVAPSNDLGRGISATSSGPTSPCSEAGPTRLDNGCENKEDVDLAPSWGKPKPRRGHLDENSDEDEDDEDEDAESQEDRDAPVESKHEFNHFDRRSNDADLGVVLRWGQARVSRKGHEEGSEDEDDEYMEEAVQENDDEGEEESDDGLDEWDFAFDMTSLRWGAADRRGDDDDDEDDEDEEGIKEESADSEPSIRPLPLSLTLRDIRKRLNERQTPEKCRSQNEVDLPMEAEAKD